MRATLAGGWFAIAILAVGGVLAACSNDDSGSPNPDGGAGGHSSGGHVSSGGSGTGARASSGGTSSGGAATGGAATGGSSGGAAGEPPDASADASDGNTCACASGVCLPDGGCAECDPTKADICGAGKYCSSAWTCLPGCRADGTGCASGSCTAEHECKSCIVDAECQAGHVCSSGTCMTNCGHDDECSGGLTCCGTRCADLTRDHTACLACDVSCGTSQFCGRSGCRSAVVANVCDSTYATILLDGLEFDDASAPVLNAGLSAGCPTPPTVRSVAQGTAGTINATTGQPVVGSGDLQLVLGGPYGQLLIRYLEESGVTPVYTVSDDNGLRFYVRSADGGPGTVAVDAPHATLTPTHSYFLFESVIDPTTKTLMFAIYGFSSEGTVAATWYFVNVILPALSTYDQSYYIYEWTNADADPAGSAGDTFRLVTSG